MDNEPSSSSPDPNESHAEKESNQSLSSNESASFWSESQVQAVIRHAGSAGRSPEEFFNRKWKKKLIHGEDSKPKESSEEEKA